MSDKKMETVLVTGGAGYIGSHLLVELLKRGCNVVTIDNLSNCYKAEKKAEPESIFRAQILAQRQLTFYDADVQNEERLREIFKKYKFDCVIHLAALKSVPKSWEMPLAYYCSNVGGTQILLKVMNEIGVKKLIVTSSSTVYGMPQFIPVTEDHPTGEGCTSPYGRSKFMQEEVCKDVCKSDQEWAVFLLRVFNPIGAHKSGTLGEDSGQAPLNLLPTVAQVAIGKIPYLAICGDDFETHDGTCVRDFTHIDDLVQGIILAMQKICSENLSGSFAYNLGKGCGYSVIEVVNTFSEVCGHKIPYKVEGRRKGDVPETLCDISRAKTDFGYIAEKSLKEMCEDMWRFQNNNPNGYREANV